ncbi:MAG: type III pantothenate kinase [Deltaproteobacteria bacterium]|nr:type III pantothenate kinase [Deltaproteobacteria bacterium]
MLLAFDIGNTNTVLGVYKEKELICEIRLKTDTSRTNDEYNSIITTLLKERLGRSLSAHGCIISSVVPPMTPIISTLVSETFKVDPIVVGPGTKTGMQIKLSEPSTVGADRVVNAVAAKHKFGTPVLVVDFGTATSFDFIGAEGSYEGGVIAPGLLVSLESLVRNTAKLPHIELTWPKSVIGKSTISAMQSGTVIGYVCMVDGLIDKIIEEVGEVKNIVATGGTGRLISKHSKRIRHYERELTLEGLRIIYDENN